VPPLVQAPLPPLVHVRELTPPVSFVMVKKLPDFEAAMIV
jgi:hypothetical protein